MRLKTFNAPDMRAAMQMVRNALGEEAVILSSQRGPNGSGVMVTAAMETEEEIVAPAPVVHTAAPRAVVKTSSRPIAAGGREQELALSEIRHVLEFHNVHQDMAERLIDVGRNIHLPSPSAKDGLKSAMATLLKQAFLFEPLPLEQEGWRIMMVGPPGIGKTLTVARIATQLTMKKKPVVVITADNSRAGALDQLAAFTGILKVPLHAAQNKKQLQNLLKQVPKNMRVIIDSAGANPYNFQEMKELGEFASVADIESILLAPAGGDCSEAEETARAYSFLGIRKLLVTRSDMARRLGNIITTAMVAELTFCNITGSPKVVDPCEPLSASTLAGLLVKHRQEI